MGRWLRRLAELEAPKIDAARQEGHRQNRQNPVLSVLAVPCLAPVVEIRGATATRERPEASQADADARHGNMRPRVSANPLMTPDEADQCHAGGWSDREVARFMELQAHFRRQGRADADDVAEMQILRDRLRDAEIDAARQEGHRQNRQNPVLSVLAVPYPGCAAEIEPPRTCDNCRHRLKPGTCAEPMKAGLLPYSAGFGIVWPDPDYAERCPVYTEKETTP